MKKQIRILAVLLAAIFVFGMAPMSFAGGSDNLPVAVEKTEIRTAMFVESDVVSNGGNGTISTMSANVSNTITIKGGGSKKYDFDMSTGLLGSGTPDSAFYVIITDVSFGSKYTVSITYDGIELVNAQYSDVPITWYVTNCSKNQKWIVIIINDRSQDMTCNVEIKSHN
ncbi:hypothetical protein FACS189425_01100 [Clostridia bacterium]|nr:hypothetical protein FACS189425_01100 [Clostridia bacterium]